MIAITARADPGEASSWALPARLSLSVSPVDDRPFGDDDRRPIADEAVRSAWACPSFYLAIPACAILAIAVGLIMAWRVIARLLHWS